MWTTILEGAKYIGICLIFGLIWLITYCVFHGDDIKTRTKTIYFVVLSEAIAAVIAFFSWWTFQQGNTDGAIIGWIISGVLAVVFAIAAVYGHKRNWKQDLS